MRPGLSILSMLIIQLDCKIFHVPKDRELRNIVRDVVRKTNSSGVLLFHVNYAKVPNDKLLYNEWMRAMAGVTTVTSINSFANSKRYFAWKDRSKGFRRCGIKKCFCLKSERPINLEILANDRVMLIIICPSVLDSKVSSHYFTPLSASESSPKVLYVMLTRDKFNATTYRNAFNFMFDKGYVNYELLEVSEKSKNKIGKRLVRLNYRIVQFDTATSRASIKPYSRKIVWFKDKVKNYQARKITVKMKWKNGYSNDPVYYDFLKTLSQAVNVTFAPVRGTEDSREIWWYYGDNFCPMLGANTNVKVLKMIKLVLVIPVIFRSSEVSAHQIVMHHLLVVLMIILTFWLLSVLAKFDRENWPPATIFIMIFGGPTARMPLTKPEIVALFCAILVGFFFAGDLVTGLTASAFEQEVEVPLNTFEDLQRHNVTIFLIYDPRTSNSEFYLEILKSKVKYNVSPIKHVYWYFSRMFKYKNVTFSRVDDYLEYWLSQRFIVKDICGFRISTLSERIYPLVIALRNRDALLHRVSDIFWRYQEANLAIKRHIKSSNVFTLKRMHPDYFKELFQIDDDQQDVDVKLILLNLIVTGTVGPIIALTIEIAVNYSFCK